KIPVKTCEIVVALNTHVLAELPCNASARADRVEGIGGDACRIDKEFSTPRPRMLSVQSRTQTQCTQSAVEYALVGKNAVPTVGASKGIGHGRVPRVFHDTGA